MSVALLALYAGGVSCGVAVDAVGFDRAVFRGFITFRRHFFAGVATSMLKFCCVVLRCVQLG